MNATIKDIMLTRVVTVLGDTPFKEMAAMLGRTRVSAFPVTDEAGKIIGIVSEADMLIKEAYLWPSGTVHRAAPEPGT